MTKQDAAYWIRRLALEPHPEGGSYRQTYRAGLVLPNEALGRRFNGPRAASTAIYFLLGGGDFSAFHRLQSDELWHFYFGQPLRIHVIEPDGRYSERRLGGDPEAGEAFQAVVEAGCWFASQVCNPDERSFSLVGCTVAPGFEFADFELARRKTLAECYPQHRDLIEKLTRA